MGRSAVPVLYQMCTTAPHTVLTTFMKCQAPGFSICPPNGERPAPGAAQGQYGVQRPGNGGRLGGIDSRIGADPLSADARPQAVAETGNRPYIPAVPLARDAG